MLIGVIDLNSFFCYDVVHYSGRKNVINSFAEYCLQYTDQKDEQYPDIKKNKTKDNN